MKIYVSVLLFFVSTDSFFSQESSTSEKTKKKKNDTTSTTVIQERKNSEENVETNKELGKNVTVSFSKVIFPLLQKHCMPCHSEEEENPSELYFESYEMLMHGGKNGVPIISGKGDSSMFIQKLRPKPTFGDQMPLPKRKTKLSEEVIQIFVDWINQGAKKN